MTLLPPVSRLSLFLFLAAAAPSYSALFDPDAAPAPATRAATLSVTPALVEITVTPGSERRFSSTLANDSDRALTVKARWMDMALGKDGNPLPQEPGKSPVTMATWASLSEDTFTVPPHDQHSVTCHIQIPAGLTGGRYGMLVFSTVQDTHGPGRQAQIELRSGTLFLLTLSGALRRSTEMSAKDLQVDREKSGDLVFKATLHNNGNVHVRVSGDLLVRDAANRIITRTKLDGGTGTLLPGGTRVFTANLPGHRAQPGPYHVEIRFTAPAMPTLTSRYDFTVPR